MPEIHLNSNGQPTRDSQGVLLDQSPKPETTAQETTSSNETTETSLLNTKDEKVEAKAESDEGKTESNAKTGAPEKYEPFKAPEGFEIDKDAVAKAEPIFKELGLNQDQAQKLVDFYSDISKSAGEDMVKATLAEQKEWQQKLTNDPEIGGAKLAQTKATINKAIDGILSKAEASAFREAMDYTGAGNHPAFAKAIFKLASLLTEAPARDHVTGNGPSRESQTPTGRVDRPSTANALYPNLP